jgi:hypothetical protein
MTIPFFVLSLFILYFFRKKRMPSKRNPVHVLSGQIRNLSLVTLFFLGLFGPRFSNAYPSFIGYGYTSCIVCHFNAFGNGPLTDYGRALGATAISSKPFYNPEVSDQQLGEASGFLGAFKMPDSLRLSADYRGLLLASQIGKAVEDRYRYINMQAEASVVVLAQENQTYAVITAGYCPPPVGQGTESTSKLISREHYLSFRLSESARLYAGFQDVVFGIRIPDHTAYSRKMTKLTQNDQTHGVNFHFGYPHSEWGIHAFVGNLYQSPSSVRPLGVSLYGEFDLAEKVRFGASSLYSKNQARERILEALHLRAGIGKGSSVLGELGILMDTPEGSPRVWANYGFLQTMTRLGRGVHFLFTAEYKTSATFKPRERFFRVGPGFQYFPMQRLELRLDVTGTRTLGSDSIIQEADDIYGMGQIHLWF